MCGILGVICNEANFENEKKWLLKSIQALKHRGPDDRKIWISKCQKVLFGHTRLSIIDLNNQNAQPMFDAKSNVTISYNGEIYNFAEIKKNLSQKFNFVTSGDTEVVLKSYLEWGDDFIDKLEGMFSIAICDQRKKNYSSY